MPASFRETMPESHFWVMTATAVRPMPRSMQSSMAISGPQTKSAPWSSISPWTSPKISTSSPASANQPRFWASRKPV